jgi:hypothetical protein
MCALLSRKNSGVSQTSKDGDRSSVEISRVSSKDGVEGMPDLRFVYKRE